MKRITTKFIGITVAILSFSAANAADFSGMENNIESLKSAVEMNNIDIYWAKKNDIQTSKLAKVKPKPVSLAKQGRVIVQLKSGAGLIDFKAELASLGAADNFKIVKSFKFNRGSAGTNQILVVESPTLATNSVIGSFSTLSSVQLSEPDYPIKLFTNDPRYNELWGLHNTGQTGGTADADIDAPEAWLTSTGSPNVVVGVIDTGVDYLHPDLAGNMWRNQAELNGQAGVDDDNNGYIDDIYGIDALDGDSDPMDTDGHGTHVAGTIGATGNNSAGVVGVNQNLQMAACKFISSNNGTLSGAIECINYFTSLKQAGVNVVVTNNSWGSYDYSQLLKNAIDAAGNAGIVFVAAASNDTIDNDITPAYPASYSSPSIISVASTDHNDQLSVFSNYGPSSVDLAAPGTDILSTVPSTGATDCQFTDSNAIWNDIFTVNGLPNWDRYSYLTTAGSSNNTSLWWTRQPDPGATNGVAIDDSARGLYPNNMFSSLSMKQDIDVSAASGQLCVSFMLKGINEAGYDKLEVYATNDSGENWSLVRSIDDASVPSWQKYSMRLNDSFKTDQFKLALVRTTDISVTFDGYLVDDLKIGQNGLSVPVGNYDVYSGTSMASPHVAGAIALAASVFPNETSNERISRALLNVDTIANLSGVVATGGRLNVAKMLESATTGIPGSTNNYALNSAWRFIAQPVPLNTVPVVIAGPPSRNGTDPSVIKITGNRKHGFFTKIKEWDYLDGSHIYENVSFLSLEPGDYSLPNGTIIKVGRKVVSGTGEWASAEFNSPFTAGTPELLLSVQGNNGNSAVTARARNVTSSGFDVALFEQESLMDSPHLPEFVGYVAFWLPDGVASIKIGGNDYAVEWLRTSLDNNWKTILGKDFFLEEDRSKDAETTHTLETVSVLKLAKIGGASVMYFVTDISTKGPDPVAIRKR